MYVLVVDSELDMMPVSVIKYDGMTTSLLASDFVNPLFRFHELLVTLVTFLTSFVPFSENPCQGPQVLPSAYNELIATVTNSHWWRAQWLVVVDHFLCVK